MQSSDISFLRLQNQHLIGEKFKTPEEVVRHLGAVQAQDYAAAKWSIGQRMKNTSDEIIEKYYNEGKILRTHIMRPTWHFVVPENIRWMQELTKNRVKQFMNTYNKKLELDEKVFSKSNDTIVKALSGGNYQTRQELKKVLERRGIRTDVQRLAHIVAYAELDALIVSGPRRGKQFTYALMDERVQKTKSLSRDESLSKLAKLYFSSHGPAQMKDFAWWSGMTIKDAQEGISMIKSQLTEETVAGKTYWFVQDKKPLPNQALLTCHLLSIYDEYTIAYKDRNALDGGRYIEKFIGMGSALTSVLIMNGQLIGTWKRALKKDSVEISIKPLRKLTNPEVEAIEKEVSEYSTFLQLTAKYYIQ
jgi:hypothetical protein